MSAPGAGTGVATVRAVTPADLDRVWELVRELAVYERLEDLLTGSRDGMAALLFGPQPVMSGVVAEVDGRIVGYALTYVRASSFRTCPRMWLEDLYVDPASRGTGAGRALLREVARRALERGCDRVDWDVLGWNRLAIDFYDRQGAKPMEHDWVTYGLDADGMRALAGDGAAT